MDLNQEQESDSMKLAQCRSIIRQMQNSCGTDVLNSKIESLEIENEKLKRDLENYPSNNNASTNNINNTNNTNNNIENSMLKGQINDCKSELRRLQQIQDTLKTQLSTKDSDIRVLNSQLTLANQEIDRLKMDQAASQQCHLQNQEQIQNLDQECRVDDKWRDGQQGHTHRRAYPDAVSAQ